MLCVYIHDHIVQISPYVLERALAIKGFLRQSVREY